ncbi:hypothetical protein JCM10599A_21910 [Paraburkholderia kururiensis]
MERLFFCSEIAASAQTERLAFCSMGDAHEPLIPAMITTNVRACSQRGEVAARQSLSSMNPLNAGAQPVQIPKHKKRCRTTAARAQDIDGIRYPTTGQHPEQLRAVWFAYTPVPAF